jgi:RNA polymerase sigma factor (sigma-70 family)
MPDALPSGAELVALARNRLAEELRALESLDAPVRWARLLQSKPTPDVSRGALVHYIRRAMDDSDHAEAEALFMALIARIEGLTRQWIKRAVLGAGLDLTAEEWREHAADLAQEHTLRLWDAIVCDDELAWELFFGRALAFAQSHVAEGWRRRVRPRALGHSSLPFLSLSPLLESGESEWFESALMASGHPDALSLVELADLRELVGRLPERERLAVVLRYWAGASEDVIAEALGGVTTRTVRNTLTRAYARLRAGYGANE